MAQHVGGEADAVPRGVGLIADAPRDAVDVFARNPVAVPGDKQRLLVSQLPFPRLQVAIEPGFGFGWHGDFSRNLTALAFHLVKATVMVLAHVERRQLAFPQAREKQTVKDGRFQQGVLIGAGAEGQTLFTSDLEAGDLANGQPVPGRFVDGQVLDALEGMARRQRALAVEPAAEMAQCS